MHKRFYVTAKTNCELLDKLRALPADEPITLVMDNARYQHCKLVVGQSCRSTPLRVESYPK